MPANLRFASKWFWSASAGLLLGATAAADSTPCFTSTSYLSLTPGTVFFANTPPPWFANGTLPASSAYYPANLFATTTVDDLNRAPPSPALRQAPWLWANRCAQMDGITPQAWPPAMGWQYGCPNVTALKGNDDFAYQPPITTDSSGHYQTDAGGAPVLLRPMFSTLLTANVCTVVQAMALSGKYNVTLTDDTEDPVPALQMQAAQLLAGTGQNITVVANNLPPLPSPLTNPLPSDYFGDIQWIESLQRKVTVTNNGTAQSATYLVDVCVVAQPARNGVAVNALADSQDLVVDYEVYDNRPFTAIDHLFQNLRQVLSSSGSPKLIAMTDDLSSGGPHNGITSATIGSVLADVDYLAPVVWTGATTGGAAGSGLSGSGWKQSLTDDIKAQLAAVGTLTAAQYAKFVPFVSLYYDSCPGGTYCNTQGAQKTAILQDYQAARSIFTANHFSGTGIFRNGEAQAGENACLYQAPDFTYPNQITACLAFNQCGGNYVGGL